MKFSKKILLCLLMFLLCGCTAKYDLIIDSDDTITERISGTVGLEELDNEGRTDLNTYLYWLDSATPLINEEGEYNKEVVDNENGKDFVYSYTYKNNFSKSNILNTCFKNIDYSETEDSYSFHLYGDFYCLLSDKVEVNLISDYGVINNNADRVDGNKYTWIIKKDKNVDIEATISKNVEAFSVNEKKSILTPYKIITHIIFASLSLALFIIYRKKTNGTY